MFCFRSISTGKKTAQTISIEFQIAMKRTTNEDELFRSLSNISMDHFILNLTPTFKLHCIWSLKIHTFEFEFALPCANAD